MPPSPPANAGGLGGTSLFAPTCRPVFFTKPVGAPEGSPTGEGPGYTGSYGIEDRLFLPLAVLFGDFGTASRWHRSYGTPLDSWDKSFDKVAWRFPLLSCFQYKPLKP